MSPVSVSALWKEQSTTHLSLFNHCINTHSSLTTAGTHFSFPFNRFHSCCRFKRSWVCVCLRFLLFLPFLCAATEMLGLPSDSLHHFVVMWPSSALNTSLRLLSEAGTERVQLQQHRASACSQRRTGAKGKRDLCTQGRSIRSDCVGEKRKPEQKKEKVEDGECEHSWF